MREIVGLYLNPPENNAVILYVDEKNQMQALECSQPMLLAGDEIGRAQKGNNNAYCQDNEISWINWNLDAPRQQLLDYTRFLIKLFRQHPSLRRRRFFHRRKIRDDKVKDLSWFRPDGKEMTDEDWCNPETRCVGERLAGDAIEATDEHGSRLVDDTLLILLNAHYESVLFVLPGHRPEQCWELVLDTQESSGRRESSTTLRDDSYVVAPRSLAMHRIKASA